MNFLKNNLKKIISASALVALIGITTTHYTPYLQSLALTKISSIGKRYLSVNVLAERASLSIFPLGLKISGINISLPEKIKNSIDITSINSVIITPNIFSLLQFKLRISSIIIQEPNLKIKIDGLLKNESHSENVYSSKKTIDRYMKQALSLPFNTLTIEGGEFYSTYKGKSLKSSSTVLTIKKRSNKLGLYLFSRSFQYKPHKKGKQLSFGSKLSLDFSSKGTALKKFYLYSKNNHINLNGTLNGLPFPLKDINGKFNLESSVDLSQLRTFVQLLFKGTSIAKLKGRIDLSAQLSLPYKEFTSKFHGKIQSAYIKHYELGQVDIIGSLNNESIFLKETKIKNSSGDLLLENTTINMNDSKYQISTFGKIKQIELNRLLASLGVRHSFVKANLNGQVPCLGEVYPRLQIKCSAKITAKNLSVKSVSTSSPNIVDIEQLQAEGDVNISLQKVTYSADIALKESKGTSSGSIDYDKGFSIKYASPRLLFSDIQNISGLNLKGSARITGKTQGTLKWGRASIDLIGRDIWLKNYFLGKIGTNIRYRDGSLSLENISGKQGQTLYNGFFKFNTSTSIFNSQLSFPYLEAQDIQQLTQRILPIPVRIFGIGHGKISANGPLDIKKLSYQMKGVLNRGSIGIETYDQALIDIKALNGVSEVQNIEFKKRDSRIKIIGSLDHRGPIDLKIISHPFFLEDSDVISQVRQNINGSLLSTTQLTGDVTQPKYKSYGQIKSLTINDKTFSDSDFNLNINDKEFSGDFNLFADTLEGRFRYPLLKGQPFLLNVNTNRWNYTRFLSFFNTHSLHQEYQGELTSEFRLSSKSGGFWTSSGDVTINKVFIKRGRLSATHTKPIRFIFNKGKIDIENFSLKGKESFLNITGKNISEKYFHVNFNGKTDLHLLQIFLPFTDEIGGPLSMSFSTKGPILKPRVFGSAFIDGGYLKLHTLTETFKEIRADLLFNQKKIIINSLKSQLNSGQIWGEGDIDLNGYKNIPININIHTENTHIEIPKGIKTTGTGQLKFTGQWFPYLLSGNYKINHGSVSQKFMNTAKKTNYIERNQFLPKIFNNDSSSLVFNLKLKIPNSVVVKTDEIQGKIKGQLDVYGSLQHPQLQGDLQLEPHSQLLFRDIPFDIIHGTLSFQRKKKINPNITLEANAHLKDYTIDLDVQGYLNDPIVTLKSNPELSDEDIVSLLAFGITSEKLNEEIDSGNQAVQSTWRLGSSILTKNPISKEIKKQLGVNVEFSSFINKSNQAVPEATFSKQLGKKTNLSVSINEKRGFNFNANYRINSNLFLKGSIDNKNNDTITDDNDDDDKNIVGFDIEYKVEFE